MLKLTHIRETELAKLRKLRNEMAAQANFEYKEKQRKQRERDEIDEYNFQMYARRTNVKPLGHVSH